MNNGKHNSACSSPKKSDDDDGGSVASNSSGGFFEPLLQSYRTFASETSAHGFRWTVESQGCHRIALW